MGRSDNEKARKLLGEMQSLQAEIDEKKATQIPKGLGAATSKIIEKQRDDSIASLEKVIASRAEKLKKLIENGANLFE